MLENLYIIFVLIVMEGLLSADNALVLSMMASKVKDPVKRDKVLYYGMVGAIAFRAFFILIGTVIVKFWIIKVIGAVYLLKMGIEHFVKKEENSDESGVVDKYTQTWLHKLLGKMNIRVSHFWSVVISIELMDLAFSVDSITAALALSDKFWVLALGGILGIVMMRFVAKLFTRLIERVPEMEHTAFVLIVIIGLKMLLGTVHSMVNLVSKLLHGSYHMHEIHVPHWLFFGILILTFAATFVVHALRKNKTVAA